MSDSKTLTKSQFGELLIRAMHVAGNSANPGYDMARVAVAFANHAAVIEEELRERAKIESVTFWEISYKDDMPREIAQITNPEGDDFLKNIGLSRKDPIGTKYVFVLTKREDNLARMNFEKIG